jgi:hypothetical protein
MQHAAPFLFNLFAEGLHWILEACLEPANGWSIHHYLDDFIVISSAPAALQPTYLRRLTSLYKAVMDQLGVPRNEDKNEHGSCVTILGVEVDSVAMEARLPATKLTRARHDVAAALACDSMSLLQAQELVGFLNFYAQVVTLGRSQLPPLFAFLRAFPPHCSRSTRRRIPHELRADLIWWRDLLPDYNRVRLLDDATRPIVHVVTDASNIGLGLFYFMSSAVDAHWRSYAATLPTAQATMIAIEGFAADDHINVKEAQAIVEAFKLYAHLWRSHRVILHTDNTTALYGVWNGYSKVAADVPLRQLFRLAAFHDIKLEASWLSSEDNALADTFSRLDLIRVANICPQWTTSNLSGLTRRPPLPQTHLTIALTTLNCSGTA